MTSQLTPPEQILARFKEPKYPYVLFIGLFIKYEKLEDGTSQFKEYFNEFCLDCSGSHAHPEKIRHYMSKGWRVAKWKLPVNESGEAIKKGDAFKGKTEFDPEHDHFEELAKFLKSIQAGEVRLTRSQLEEFERTKKELEEIKEKVAKSNKKSTKPEGGQNEQI